MNYWINDNPETKDMVNTRWVVLVSEKDGGIIAAGRRDIIEGLAEVLNDKPDDWDGEV
jgi:hypothetical protein